MKNDLLSATDPTGKRRFLTRGDTIGVVATGFAVRPPALDAGVERLRRSGYRVVEGGHVRSRDGYLAGNDAERASDLAGLLRQPQISTVWFARGGYGTSRLLESAPWAALRRDPKLLVGYSDLTALFAAAVERTDALCLYGPVVTELADRSAWHRPSLAALAAGEPWSFRLRTSQVLAAGKARGKLVGGNLTVLTHLLGTRFAPDFRDCVLFLEETGEQTYRIDRMLTHLRLAGALRRLAGVILGSFAVPRRRRFPPDRELDAVLAESFSRLGVPVVTGVQAGHVPAKRTLPLGARVTIDTGSRVVRFDPRSA